MKKDTTTQPDTASLTYDSAYAELRQILQNIQDDAVSIDDLKVNIERAGVLIRFCREKLRDTEAGSASMDSRNCCCLALGSSLRAPCI
jgi:exodeoxyribonuclease VII small subunit